MAASLGGADLTKGCFLEAVSLRKDYNLGGRTVSALRGVSFTLPAGKSLSITGYSGSGKSTLLGLLGGLDRPTSGDVILDGASFAAMSEVEITRLRRQRIGFVFQTFNLFPALSAIENVLLSARVAGLPKSEAKARSGDVLAAVGMADRARHKPGQLSGGEQQRVAVARALVYRPALLLADEPTGDLDTTNAGVVSDLIFNLCRENGSTCVYATHNLDLAARADFTVSMKDGLFDRGGLRHVGQVGS